MLTYPGNLSIFIANGYLALGPFAEPLRLLFAAAIMLWLQTPVYAVLITCRSLKWTPINNLTINVSDASFLSAAILLIIIGRMPSLIGPMYDPDEGQWLSTAAAFCNNPIPFSAVDGYSCGPLTYILPLVVTWLGCTINYASFRLFGLVCYTLPSIVAVYFAVKAFSNQTIARLAVLPLIIVLALMVNAGMLAYNGEQLPVLCIALALFGIGKLQAERVQLSYVALIGLTLGIAPWGKLQVMPIVAIIFIWVLFLLLQKRIKCIYICCLLLFGLLPTLLMGSWLWATHSMGSFYDNYIVANFFYANSNVLRGLGTSSDSVWQNILSLLSFCTDVPDTIGIIGLGLLFVVIAILSLSQKMVLAKETRVEAINMLFSVTVLGSAFYGCAKPGTYFGHYQHFLLMPITMLFGVAFSFWNKISRMQHQASGTSSASQKHIQIKRVTYNAAIIVFVAFGVLLPAAAMLLGTRSKALVGLGNDSRKSMYYLGQHSEVGSLIKSLAQPDDRLCIWGWDNNLYAETGLVQATLHSNIFYEVMPSAFQHKALQAFAKRLIISKPAFVVEAVGPNCFYFKDSKYSLRYFPLVGNYIDSNYVQIYAKDSRTIYLREDLVDRLKSRLITQ